MTITYASARSKTRESATAVHLAGGEAHAAPATACDLDTRNRLITNNLERVTCRTCRTGIERAEA